MKKLLAILALITTIVYAQDSSRVLTGSAQPPLPFNMIPQSGFENRTTGWSVTGGVFTATSTTADVARGTYSGKWTPPASTVAGVLFQSDAITIPPGLYNHTCKAQMWFRGNGSTNGTFNIEAYDGTNILGTATLPDNTYYGQVQSSSFTCPTSGTLRLRVRNTATTISAPTAMYFDDAIITDTSWLGVGSSLTGVSTFGSTPNSAGASVSGNNLILQPASGSQPGGVTTGAQTFAGAKTFSSAIIATLTGNADTATNLAANPTDCSAGQFANSIAANGDLTCAAVTSSLPDAAADGATKGISAYIANDFNASSGIISLDYTNGQAASGSNKGFLTAADWTTFNGKQASGNYITALTGDVTASGPGSVAATLAASGVSAGSYTNAAITVDAKGRITSASTGSVSGSPLTTKGDIYGFSTADARLPVGTNGQALLADSAQALGVKWGAVSPLTTKGDINVFSTVGDRLPVGTNGQVLSADSAEATGLKWIAASSGSGDVVGPSSATDNALARFDSTTGKLIQNSSSTIGDGGELGVTSSLVGTGAGATTKGITVSATETGNVGSDNIIGISTTASMSGSSGTFTKLTGQEIVASATRNGANIVGLSVAPSIGAARTLSADMVGIKIVNPPATGSVDNYYGLYIDGPYAGTVANNNYALYVNGYSLFKDGIEIDDYLNVFGKSDTNQLLVRGHSTQTSSILRVQKSDATDLFKIENSGAVTQVGAADAVQLSVKGFSTQTSNIFDVQKSDATKLFSVTNTAGSLIRGTTTNDSAATGFVGEYVSSSWTAVTFPATTTWADATSISLTAGDWDVTVSGDQTISAGTVTVFELGLSTTSGNSTSGLTYGSTRMSFRPTPTSSGHSSGSLPVIRVSLSATTTYYAKISATYLSAPDTTGIISARRVR